MWEQSAWSPVSGAAVAGLVVILALLLLSNVMVKAKALPYTERGYVPFLGVALSFFADVNGYLEERRRQLGPSRPVRLLLLGRWWTVVYEKPDIKFVLNAKESELSFLGGFKDVLGKMMPKGFTFVPRQHFFIPGMRQPHMEGFVGVMRSELLEEARRWGIEGTIELFATMRVLVMRMNLGCLFGPRIFEEGRFEAYHKAFEDIDPEKGLVDFLTSLLSPNKKEVAWVTIRSITEQLIRVHEAVACAEAEDTAQPAQQSLLEGLVRAARAEGRSLDVDVVTADLFAFVFASFTNTFAVLAWTIWELATRPELLGRVQAEAAGRDVGRLEDVEGMALTRAVTYEVIRLRTPGLTFRKVTAPDGVTLSTGETIPCGEFLAFSARHVSLLPEFWSDPTRFDPDRMLPPREEHKSAGPFSILWGAGRHPCLGSRFASAEIAATVATLFDMFDIRPSSTAQPVVSKSQIGTADKPIEPVYISYKRRRSE